MSQLPPLIANSYLFLWMNTELKRLFHGILMIVGKAEIVMRNGYFCMYWYIRSNV